MSDYGAYYHRSIDNEITGTFTNSIPLPNSFSDNYQGQAQTSYIYNEVSTSNPWVEYPPSTSTNLYQVPLQVNLETQDTERFCPGFAQSNPVWEACSSTDNHFPFQALPDHISSTSGPHAISIACTSPFSHRRVTPEPRDVLELRASDPRFVDASWRIIEIMYTARLLPNHTVNERNVALQGAIYDLDSYICTLPDDVKVWVETHRRRKVGVSSAKSHAETRRKHVEAKGLHICLWCSETITARLNLANHVRSHLGLHLSFCNHCEYSSVSQTLPARHQCRRR